MAACASVKGEVDEGDAYPDREFELWRIRYERAHVYQTEHHTRVVLDRHVRPWIDLTRTLTWQFNLPRDLKQGFFRFDHNGMQGFVAVYEWDPKEPRLAP